MVHVPISTTGAINNPNFSDADQILMTNASAATISGLAAGVGGQRVTIISKGSGQVDLANQNTNSSTANRLANVATSGNTSLAAGFGAAMYEYDATLARWRLVAHEQGAFITHPYSAGDYTGSASMTWTVDSGDVITFKYFLNGKHLTILIFLQQTTVGGTADTTLSIPVPGGFTTATTSHGPCVVLPAGAMALGRVFMTATGNRVNFSPSGNWVVGTNSTTIEAMILAEVV